MTNRENDVSEKSRTEHSAANMTVAMVARVVAIVAGYLTRVMFTHTLSAEYVGVNGLFTDILNVLALSELGIGTAITYALYRPIAEKDTEKQKSLMMLYRSLYRAVAVIVLAAGLMVVPLIDVLMKDQQSIEHLTFLYLFYLANSVVSYLLIYKRTLIDAHQLSYIGVLYHTVFLILQNVIQMAILHFTRNFTVFLLVQLLCTVASNLAISWKADRMYPYLRDRSARRLPKEERRDIFLNIRAMLMHKIGDVVVNHTDHLLLSLLVGYLSVGSYSNYYLIIGSVRQVLNQAFQGIAASVGNLGVEANRARIRIIYESLFFLGQWVFGLVTICLYVTVDVFVEISFGAQYVFSRDITLVLCLNFYLTGMRQATLVFRDSMGVFKYDRYKAIPEALINLGTSLALGRLFGTVGIFLGTLVSIVTTSLWVEPYMFYKHRLQTSSRPYFVRYFTYAALTFALWWGAERLCRQITGGLWFVLLTRLLVSFALVNIAFLVIFHRTKEFRLLMNRGMGLLKRRLASVSGATGK